MAAPIRSSCIVVRAFPYTGTEAEVPPGIPPFESGSPAALRLLTELQAPGLPPRPGAFLLRSKDPLNRQRLQAQSRRHRGMDNAALGDIEAIAQMAIVLQSLPPALLGKGNR